MTPEKKREIADAVLERYRWYAVDANGDEYVFEDEPEIDLEIKKWIPANQYCHLAGNIDMTGIDWRETKERVDE